MSSESTDPNKIPQHVIDAAWRGFDCTTDEIDGSIAAALDALMNDEPVRVPCGDVRWGAANVREVRPSDVLAAVLKRDAP